jgi:hypothetical protein
VHGITGTTSLAATALQKKADKEAEKVLKAKEKALQEKLERSKKAAVPSKKRSSSSSKKSASSGKRRKSGSEVVDLSESGGSGGVGTEAVTGEAGVVIDGPYESVTYIPDDEDDTQAPYRDVTGPTAQLQQEQEQEQEQEEAVRADSDDELWSQEVTWKS